MRKLIIGLLVFLLAAALAAYLLYPTVSDQLAGLRDGNLMRDYRAKAAALDEEAVQEHFRQAREYNDAIESFHPEDVFTSGNIRTDLDYQSRLNIHSGIIGELIIPAIRVSLPVYHQSSETPATAKLVHLDGSSLPADGTKENIVLAGPGVLKAEGILGQLNLTDDRMLEDLDSLTPGDVMILTVMDRTMVYRVSEVQMLSAAGLKELDLTPGEEDRQLTVISRHQDRRLLVRSSGIPIAEARVLLEGEDKASYPDNWKNVLLLGSPVLLLGLLLIWIIERFKMRSYKLPDEGRLTAARERKRKAKLENLTTDTERVEDENEKDKPENPVPGDSADAGNDRPAGDGSGE